MKRRQAGKSEIGNLKELKTANWKLRARRSAAIEHAGITRRARADRDRAVRGIRRAGNVTVGTAARRGTCGVEADCRDIRGQRVHVEGRDRRRFGRRAGRTRARDRCSGCDTLSRKDGFEGWNGPSKKECQPRNRREADTGSAQARMH